MNKEESEKPDPRIENYEGRLNKLLKIRSSYVPYKNCIFSSIEEEIAWVKKRISQLKK